MEETCIEAAVTHKAKYPKWLPKPRLQCQIIKHDEHTLSDDTSKCEQYRVASLKCMKNSWMYEYLMFARKLRKSRVDTSINAYKPGHRRQVHDCSNKISIETQTSKIYKTPLQTVTMENFQGSETKLKSECTQIEPITFVELNRQRLQYEKLGISVTAEEMISMNILRRQIRYDDKQREQDRNQIKRLAMREYQQELARSTKTDTCQSYKRDYRQLTYCGSKMPFHELKVPYEQSCATHDYEAQEQLVLSKLVSQFTDNVDRQPDSYDMRRKRSHSISSELLSDYMKSQSMLRRNPRRLQMKAKQSLSNSAMHINVDDETSCHADPHFSSWSNTKNDLEMSAYQQTPIIIPELQIPNSENETESEQAQYSTINRKQSSENSKTDSITSCSSEKTEIIYSRPKQQTVNPKVFEYRKHSSMDLRSSDTLIDVWHTEGMLEGRNRTNRPISRLRGGLLNHLISPNRHLNNTLNLSDEMSLEAENSKKDLEKEKVERKLETKKRLAQLREFQRLADLNFKRFLKFKGELCRHEINITEIDSKYCRCPVGKGKCEAILNQKLLSHFVANHLNEPGIEVREIHEGDRLLLVFDANAFELGINVCTSILTYGGFRGHPETRPVFRYMPVRNFGLPLNLAEYSGHLPILLMISRTTRLIVEQNTCHKKRVHFEDEDSRHMESDEEEELIVFWAASLELPEPIHVMITVFNKNMTATRTAIIKTRSLLKSHDVNDVINHDLNHMILTDADITVLSNFNDEAMYLELTVREYGADYPFLFPYKAEK